VTIPPAFEWRRPRRRSRGYLRWIALAAAVLLAFALGIAVGEALHDNPSGSGSVTFVTTLQTSR
jgi:hypothetical protein